MRNKKIIVLPLVLFSLALSGCGNQQAPSYVGELVEQGYTKTKGWPTTQITTFLSEFDLTSTVPTLNVTGDSFYYTFDGDENFYPHMGIFLPSVDRIEDFNTLLATSTFTSEYDDEYESYIAINDTETLMLTYSYEEASEDVSVAGTLFYIDVLVEEVIIPGTDDDLVDMGYTEVAGWPGSEITTFVSGFDMTVSIPGLTVSGNSYVLPFYGDADYYPVLEVALPGEDRVAEYLTLVEAAGFPAEFDAEYGTYYGENSSATAAIEFFYDVASDGYPAGTYIYIILFTDNEYNGNPGENPDPGTTDDLLAMGYTEVAGWPGSEISTFITGFKMSANIPSLTISGNSYIDQFYGDDEYYPYMEIVLPGGDRSEEYLTLVNAAGFNASFDAEYGTYYGENSSATAAIEFFYDVASDGYPEGTYIYLVLYTDETYSGDTGGTTPIPTNPDGAAIFSFANSAQIIGEKNILVTSWASEGTILKIEKGESNVNVGNYGVSTTNDGQGYFEPELRIYYSQQVTITAPSGSLIQQIVFTTGADTSKINNVSVLSSSAPSGVVATSGNGTVTFVVNSPSNVITFTASAQFRIVEFTVYFA